MIRFIRCIPALLILSCSWYLSAQPHIEEMPTFWNADKLVHIVCFGGFAFWVAFGLNIQSMKIRLKIMLPTIIVSLYGIIDEIHQSYTPGRTSSATDWVADTLGALLGSVCFIFVCSLIDRAWQKK